VSKQIEKLRPKIGYVAKYFPDYYRAKPMLVKDAKAMSN